MPDGFGAVVRNGEFTQRSLKVMQAEVDLGTVAALKKATAYTRTRIRGGMRGRPRWDRKGPDKTTGQFGVNLNLNPHHVRKNGGPGQLTGNLYQSIRKSRKPARKTYGTYSAVVFSGGNDGYQNRYKRRIESEYPYFKPGVAKAVPKLPIFYETAWAKATKGKSGGFV